MVRGNWHFAVQARAQPVMQVTAKRDYLAYAL